MSEERPGIVQYVENIKENIGGSVLNSIFFNVLKNRSIFDQVKFYMKNIELRNIDYKLSEGKNEKLAQKHRENGNELFSSNNFAAALDSYNKSLTFGRKSENLSLCYANRSAVYFELGMFQKCLENINIAKGLKLPAHVMAKLNKRAEDANRGLLLSENENMKFNCFDKLSQSASEHQPFIVDCLEGSNLDDLKKREIRTKNALAAGDIISKETKPFSKLLKRKLIFSHCTFCLSTDAAMSMIPCKSCSTAMFCNEKCYEKANDLFHRIECPIIDAIYGMLSESMWLGLRTVVMAITICGSVKNFEEFLTSVNGKKENIFEQIFERPENAESTNKSDLDQFKAIMNLPVNEEFNLEDCAGTAFAIKLLKDNTNTKLIDDNNIEFMATAIYKSMKVARYNALLLEETYSMIGLTNETTFYGIALYPFACNFILSCAPNVLMLNHNKSMLGVVIRPVPSGGVLYAGLAALNHVTGDRNYRQELKLKHLDKTCDCIACSLNYGRMEKLLPLPNVAQPTLPNALAVAAFLDRTGDMLLKQYNFLCDYLNKNPDLEYLSLQMAGAINQLIFTLGKMALPPAIVMKLGESLGEKI